eukprot:9753155-Prorocentrum_lima.AAC.1
MPFAHPQLQTAISRGLAALRGGACQASGGAIYTATWADLWMEHLTVWLIERSATRRWMPTDGQ